MSYRERRRGFSDRRLVVDGEQVTRMLREHAEASLLRNANYAGSGPAPKLGDTISGSVQTTATFGAGVTHFRPD